MGKFNFIPTGIEGLVVVEPTVFGDARGYFMETYQKEEFAAAYGDKVCSITSGTVKTVYEDVLWGWTVEVEGTDGLLRYAGLAHKPAVKEGEAVTAGDVLGKLD